jgi:hypothetical protein
MNNFILPENLFPLLVVIGIWDSIWKIFAMWKAARNDSKIWFVALMLLNTIGILPMIYLLIEGKLKKTATIS